MLTSPPGQCCLLCRIRPYHAHTQYISHPLGEIDARRVWRSLQIGGVLSQRGQSPLDVGSFPSTNHPSNRPPLADSGPSAAAPAPPTPSFSLFSSSSSPPLFLSVFSLSLSPRRRRGCLSHLPLHPLSFPSGPPHSFPGIGFTLLADFRPFLRPSNKPARPTPSDLCALPTLSA
jgi:hypothetical protein